MLGGSKMSRSNLNKQKKVEKYIISPSTHLFLGLTVKKDTYIEDELKLPNKRGTIHQIIKDLTLTTIINRKWKECGIETEEKSKLVQKVPEGIILIWGEDTGYIIPNYKMKSVEGAIEDLNAIRGV